MILHKTKKYVKILNKSIIKQNNGIVNAILYSNSCGKFIVTEKYRRINNHTEHEIKFIDTNQIYMVRDDRLVTGEVKDYMSKTIYNVACLGLKYKDIKKDDPELCHKLYKHYKSMIGRCYYPKDSSYKFYGKIGIHVDNDWLNFSNYYTDIISMKDFNCDEFLNGYIIIDKDIKQSEILKRDKVYSKKTVSLIDYKTNLRYRDMTNAGHITALKYSKYFAMLTENIISYHKNICKFSRDTGINESSIRDVLHKRTLMVQNKYKFRYLTDIENNLINNKLIELNKTYYIDSISSTTIPRERL